MRDEVLACWKKTVRPSTSAKSLEADVELYAEGVTYEYLRESGVFLGELFNVSQVRVIKDFQKVRSGDVRGPRKLDLQTLQSQGVRNARLRREMRPLLELHA